MRYDDSSGRAGRSLRWRKSSFSMTGECVEVADCDGDVAVRNSNNPDAGTLVFGRAVMAAWVAGLKAGEFDDLA